MVATNPIEVKVQRRLLAEYLRRDHIKVALQRPTIVSTPAGGKKRTNPTPLTPQKFRLYPILRRQGLITRDTPDGDIINYKWILVGFRDADVKVSDYFVYENKRYSIESIMPNREVKTIANVTYHGPHNDEPWDGG